MAVRGTAVSSAGGISLPDNLFAHCSPGYCKLSLTFANSRARITNPRTKKCFRLCRSYWCHCKAYLDCPGNKLHHYSRMPPNSCIPWELFCDVKTFPSDGNVPPRFPSICAQQVLPANHVYRRRCFVNYISMTSICVRISISFDRST